MKDIVIIIMIIFFVGSFFFRAPHRYIFAMIGSTCFFTYHLLAGDFWTSILGFVAIIVEYIQFNKYEP